MPEAPIDRKALVTRHNVTFTKFDGERPLQVGNGEFAFGMDITGLQTFVPFNTMSHWGWHSGPMPAGTKLEDYKGQVWDTHGRPVRYPMEDSDQPALSAWLAGSPHAINLGRVGLILTKKDGTPATAADLQNPVQKLDLWTGLVTSRFEIEGQPVTVITACNPKSDSIAAQVKSALIKTGRLSVFVDAPGNNPLQFANFIGDWSGGNHLQIEKAQNRRVDFVRRMDEVDTHISLTWQGDAEFRKPISGPPFQVIKAEYGAQDKWVDVTEIAKSRTVGGRLVLRAGNDRAGDPILKVPKSLRVTYEFNGRTETVEAAENESVVIDPTGVERRFTLRPAATADALTFAVTFAPRPNAAKLPTPQSTLAASQKHWPTYWKSGGAIDLSGSKDPRWRELERRIVLSQYLMAVNEAGSNPPQESGLVNNGWFGRWHMEMVWWHCSHWALWNRWPELNRNLAVYKNVLAMAKKTAKNEGYLGARWPKCIGPGPSPEWPHPIHSFLAWQQPHPIFFAELDYRAHPTRATLQKWAPIVEATADFMASYAFFDKATNRYVLGPPLHLASENTDPKLTQNPTFELGYWRFGLRVAQEWRKRMGLASNAEWAKVQRGLSPLPTENGLYILHEGVKDMWTKWNFEHPALTAAYGLLPGDGADRGTMRRTLDKVVSVWDFNHTWGWDFPMLAMCAARVGEPDRAIELLLHPAPGFQFDERGLATGGPFPYFPSNGGLLYAIAMMAQGWDGAPQTKAPGFPKNGKWKVKYEGLSRAL